MSITLSTIRPTCFGMSKIMKIFYQHTPRQHASQNWFSYSLKKFKNFSLLIDFGSAWASCLLDETRRVKSNMRKRWKEIFLWGLSLTCKIVWCSNSTFVDYVKCWKHHKIMKIFKMARTYAILNTIFYDLKERELFFMSTILS